MRRRPQMISMIPGLVDTSVFVGIESRGIDLGGLDLELSVSAVVLGELRSGVLRAATVEARAIRLATYEMAASLAPIPVDRRVAESWAGLVAALREAGERLGINDSWIAATALAHGMTVVTQDAGFERVPGLDVLLV
jgi:predicted nucleic acid-binding protein